MTDDEGLERIEKALGRLGSQHVPPSGWEDRVLAATVGRPRPKWVWRIALVGAPVAAAAAVWILITTRVEPLRLSVLVSKPSGQAKDRAGDDDPKLGDDLKITASGGEHRALRVYLRGQLILDCSRNAACTETDDALTAPLKLDRIGDYVIVALSDEEPLEPPKGDYDTDIAHAQNAGATIDRDEFTIY